MEYPRIAVSFVALLAGSAGIGIAVLVYRQHRKPVALYLAGLQLSLLFFLTGMTITVFEVIDTALDPVVSRFISFGFMVAGGLLLLLATPWFYHELVGERAGPARRAIYRGLPVVFAATTVVVFLSPYWMAPQMVLNYLLSAMVAYVIIMCGLRLRWMRDRRLRRVVVGFLVLSAIFFPLMYLDLVSPVVSAAGRAVRLRGMSLPTYFLLLNSLFVGLAAGYLSDPPYLKNGAITRHFTDSFDLSAGEREVLEAALDGSGDRETGERLSLSAETVENLVSTVCRKTGARNRSQLFSMIRGNRSGRQEASRV